METVTHDQAKIKQFTDEGKANGYDMAHVLNKLVENQLPIAFPRQHKKIKHARNLEIVPAFLRIEKDFKQIPWIDTNKAIFIEVPSTIITDTQVLFEQGKRLAKLGFPVEQCQMILLSFFMDDKKEEQKAKKAKQPYARPATFLFTMIPEEADSGAKLATVMDATKDCVYSLCTAIPVTLSQRHQHMHFRSLIICLLNKIPDEETSSFSTLEYDFEVSDNGNLNFFICFKQ